MLPCYNTETGQPYSLEFLKKDIRLCPKNGNFKGLKEVLISKKNVGDFNKPWLVDTNCQGSNFFTNKFKVRVFLFIIIGGVHHFIVNCLIPKAFDFY